MKKLHILLLALGVGFFAYLLWSVGFRQLRGELAQLGWGLVPLILAEGVSEMIHTLGWRHCLSGPLRALPWRTLFGIRMAGYAINYVTPTAALGGEVTKAALLASHCRGAEAASGVLIGKLCFAVAHLSFVVLGAAVIAWQVKLPGTLLIAMVFSGGLVGTGVIAFLLLQKHGKLGAVVRWLAAHKIGGRALEKAASDVTAVDDAMKRFYHEHPRDLPLAVCWHLVGYSIGIAQTWLFLRLLHQEASWPIAAGAWFLGMWFDLLTFAVPLNIGALEGGRIVAFKAIGYTALAGMTYGIVLRLSQMFWAGFGLVAYALLAARARPRQRAGPMLPGQGSGEGVGAQTAPASPATPASGAVDSLQP
jgi:uncharacterized protein (TIRG00374 family)